MSPLKSILLALLLLSPSLAANASSAKLEQEAKQKIQVFAKSLKASLSTAIKTGGLSAGVEVCNEQAPSIAKSLSINNWQLSRISLKPRNTQNTPTPQQKKVLEMFEQQKAEGKPVNDLLFVKNNDDSFEMIKAIPTSDLCLKCHGKAIKPALQKTISHLYPHDKATGFSIGDLRGAFVIRKSFGENQTNEQEQ